MCKTRLDTKIHPRLVRGCKVRVKAGSHHRPSRRCRIRGNPKTQKRHNRKMRDSGQPEDPLTARPKERRCGATHRFATGGAERLRAWGNPRLQRRERWRVRDPGQPGEPSASGAEGYEDSGQPGDSSVGRAGRSRIRGNPKTHREARLEERRFGATRRFTHRDRRRMRDSRQLEAPSPAQQEDAGDEETRSLIRKLDGTMRGSRACGTP
jgi:hypothetical protein